MIRAAIVIKAAKYPHWKISRPYRGELSGRYSDEERISFRTRSTIAIAVKIPRIAVGSVKTVLYQSVSSHAQRDIGKWKITPSRRSISGLPYQRP